MDIALGSKYEIAFEYYRPLTPLSRWFIAPRISASRTPFNLYFESNLLAEYRLNSVTGGLDIGYGFDRFSDLRFGYRAGFLEATAGLALPCFRREAAEREQTRLRYAVDRLDNPIVPRHGAAILSNAR